MNIRTFCKNILKEIAEVKVPPLSNCETIENNSSLDRLFDICKLLITTSPNELMNEKTARPLIRFLYLRWMMIRGSNLAYPHRLKNQVNLLCIYLAEELEALTGINRFFLLMPTLEVLINEISSTSLDDQELKLFHIILSDDQKRFIEVFACLDYAQEDGVLKHLNLIDGEIKPLSESEAYRLINHSKETREFYSAIMARVRAKKSGGNFGAVINGLIADLREGGAHQKGSEFDSGRNANEGIHFFAEWLERLNSEEKEKLFACRAEGLSDDFGALWGRLARPIDALNMPSNTTDGPQQPVYQQQIYCVEIIGGNLQQILDENEWLYDTYPANETVEEKRIERYDREFNEKRNNLTAALSSNNYYVVPITNENSDEYLANQLAIVVQRSNDLIKIGLPMHRDFFAILLKRIIPFLKDIFSDAVDFNFTLQQLATSHARLLIEVMDDKIIDYIDDGFQLALILNKLPERKQKSLLKMLIAHKTPENIITSKYQLAAVLDQLHESLYDLLFENLNSFENIFYHFDDLTYVLDHISQRYYYSLLNVYLFHFLDIVTNGNQLTYLLPNLTFENSLVLVEHFLPKLYEWIETAEQLFVLLREAPILRYEILSNINKDIYPKIANTSTFLSFLRITPQRERMELIDEFISYLPQILTKGEHVAQMLDLLLTAERMQLIRKIKFELHHLLGTELQYHFVRTRLPREDHAELATLYVKSCQKHSIAQDHRFFVIPKTSSFAKVQTPSLRKQI